MKNTNIFLLSSVTKLNILLLNGYEFKERGKLLDEIRIIEKER